MENTTQENLPQWDLSIAYSSIASDQFKNDFAKVGELISSMANRVEKLKPKFAEILASHASKETTADAIKEMQSIAKAEDEAIVLYWTMKVFVSCLTSVDSKNLEAQSLLSELEQIGVRFGNALNPIRLFLARAPENVAAEYLKAEATSSHDFLVWLERRDRDHLLSESEETLISSLSLQGLHAWGDLYNKISGQLQCKVVIDGNESIMGLAQASGLVKGSHEPTRKAAWQAIQSAWKTHQDSIAATLNSLAGWRIEVSRKRSHTKPIDFMHESLRNSFIEPETLEAMMTAVEDFKPTAQKAVRLMANRIGKKALDPWDTLAGAPSDRPESMRSFAEGFELVRSAFSAADPTLGELADTMLKNRWIEARVLPNKRNGAFCTYLSRTRNPLIFQTYLGSLNDVRTMAHELGHAYHSWVQRDMPLRHRGTPMTLAETASVFAETAFADHVSANAMDQETKFEIAWQNAETAVSFLINIPTRYEFEREFYRRREKTFVGADELSDIMAGAWTKWYGDTVTEPDRLFWASKLHFSISRVSFYNYPYTFGYLFSLALYAKRHEPGFMKRYIALLQDTGRMTAEAVVQKHLGEDIRKPEFWRKSLSIVAGQIEHFESIMKLRNGVKP